MTPHPVILMHPNWETIDFTVPKAERRHPDHPWLIGRYLEDRVDLYQTQLFTQTGRSIHLGIDLGAPVGVAVHAPFDGIIRYQGALPEPGDYGHAIVIEFVVDQRPVFVLFGHLSAASIQQNPIGYQIAQGEVLGWLGADHENGGWPPHLHLQTSWTDPKTHDMPGVASALEAESASKAGPDPRTLLEPWLVIEDAPSVRHNR